MSATNWIITKGVRWVGSLFDGYKTKIGGAGLILTGIVAAINLIWPGAVPGMPDMDIDQIIGSITGGLIAIGLGSKIDKNTAAVLAAQPPADWRAPDAVQQQIITTPDIDPAEGIKG